MSDYPRELSARERRVLEVLLGQDFPGRDSFIAQLSAATVVAGCPDCPCPSVELAVDPACMSAPHNEHVAGHVPLPVEAVGPGCDLILFHDKGRLAYLECVIHDPDEKPVRELPRPEDLDVFTLPVDG